MQDSELKNKGIAGVGWNFFGKISTHVVTFLVTIVLSRLLSTEDFGLVAMAMVFISISQAFMDFGLTTALIQKKNPTETQINTIFYINFMLAIVLMLITISCSDLIGRFYNNEKIVPIIRFVSYLFILYAANGVQRAMLTKELKIKTLTISSLSGALVQGVAGIGLALSGYGVWSLIYSTFLGNITTTIFLWIQSTWRPKLMFKLKEVKELFDFGYKVFLSKLLDSVYTKLDELIIGKIFAADTLGLYYRAKSFNHMIVAYTSDSLSGVFFPVISQVQDDKKQVKKVVVQSLEVVSFLTFGLIALLYLDAESLIILLFGEQWTLSVGYFKVLAFSAYGFPISAILVNVLLGLGHSGSFLKLEVWKKIIGLSGMAIGFVWGIYGFLWALVAINVLGVTLNMWYVSKFIEIKVLNQWRILIKYAILALLSALPVWLLNQYLPCNLWLLLVIDTLIFGVLYLSMNILFKNKGFIYTKDIFVKKVWSKLRYPRK